MCVCRESSKHVYDCALPEAPDLITPLVLWTELCGRSEVSRAVLGIFNISLAKGSRCRTVASKSAAACWPAYMFGEAAVETKLGFLFGLWMACAMRYAFDDVYNRQLFTFFF